MTDHQPAPGSIRPGDMVNDLFPSVTALLTDTTQDIDRAYHEATNPEDRAQVTANRLTLLGIYTQVMGIAAHTDHRAALAEAEQAEEHFAEMTGRIGDALNELAVADVDGGADADHLWYVVDQTARALLGPAYPDWVADRGAWHEGTPR